MSSSNYSRSSGRDDHQRAWSRVMCSGKANWSSYEKDGLEKRLEDHFMEVVVKVQRRELDQGWGRRGRGKGRSKTDGRCTTAFTDGWDYGNCRIKPDFNSQWK